MLKHLTPVILISVVTACSTPMERRHANGNDEFIHVNEKAMLSIPNGLKTPNYSREYVIPKLAQNENGKLGKSLDIRPPLQVLPMAEGTRVEEGSDNIKIVIESIDNKMDLKKEIFTALEHFLKKKNIGISSKNYDSGIIETDWIENNEVIDSSFWGDDKVYTLKQRYEFDVQIRPHGRTGALTIKLIQHEESYDGDKRDIVLTNNDKRRYTIDMLNSAVSYISMERNREMKAKRIQQSLGIKVQLVESPKAYWVADSDFNETWERLRIVLPELGFEITDMNREQKLFYINYNNETSFWSSLWGDEKLTLEKGGYRIELSNQENKSKTRIYLKDLAGEPLKNQTIIDVYNAFSHLMAEDRKLK